jgi:type II secretory pathway pseudopilin PulG
VKQENRNRRERVGRIAASSDGFTISELVISMAILLIVLVGVLGAVQFAAAATKQAATRQGAIQLANQRIEYARNIPYQALGTKNANGTFGDPAGVLPANGESVTTTSGAYTVTYDVWWKRKDDPDPAARTVMYKQVQVTVNWTLPRAGSVSVETAIYGVDTGAVIGDVQVYALDVDTISALPGTAVTLAPISGPSRMVETADDGYALFGQVPYGLITSLAATKDGYMTDPSSLTSKTVSPNVVNTWSVSLQRPKNATIHVQTTAGAPIQGASVMLTNTERGLTYGPFTTNASGDTAAFPNLWNAEGTGYTATATYNGNSASSSFVVRRQDTSVIAPPIVIELGAQFTLSVVDDSGKKLDGAAIALTGPVNPYNDGSLTTSPGGTKVFTITRSGTYTANASKSGYTSAQITFNVDLSNPTNPQPIVLVENVTVAVSLRITVSDKFDGKVLKDRYVTVWDGAGNLKGSGTTDKNGRIGTISISAAGTYTVKVEARDNYQAFSGTVTIAAGGPSTVNYTADTITGRITVQVRGSGGSVPSNANDYRVRLRYLSGGNWEYIPGADSQYRFDDAGNFTFAPLEIGSYQYSVRDTHGNWSSYAPAATVVTGVSTPYEKVHVVN